MATVTFYYDLKSQPCRAVYLFLKSNDIPFKSVLVDLMSGEHLQDEFKAVSSIQKVPVIDDGGFVLTESASIMRYVARKYNVPEHWFPSLDPRKESRMNEYLHWHHFINTVRGRPVKTAELKRYKTELTKSLTHLDTYFLRNTPYLCGNDISVADLLCITELFQLVGTCDEGFLSANSKVEAWVKRVRDRMNPAFDKVNEDTVYKMREVYKRTKSANASL